VHYTQNSHIYRTVPSHNRNSISRNEVMRECSVGLPFYPLSADQTEKITPTQLVGRTAVASPRPTPKEISVLFK